MTIEQARKRIIKAIKKAIKDGNELTRDAYGIDVEDGQVVADGPVCGLAACALGVRISGDTPRLFWSDSIDYDAIIQEVVGLTEDQQGKFISGFDDGNRKSGWARLGDDIATKFLGPLEPMDTEPAEIFA